ncbi:GntR family transcriptional regulator [Sphingobacterium bambusae]|uniref:GntR family transcriptional regulator n=1 Tax=Sphingobacterium bambusae TaxID=662858 RepID=A0ABW6BNG3_9SPHI|nr:GntR family transcriptional regulator [Sphingobacterium bambusae]WPL48195.1 GntR family transcriptional regulator [Sphingobacterium bambusae]
MDFSANKAIYVQIAEHVCEHIMLGTWKDEEKVPSVRDLAVQLEVNPNTVMRTYDLLQQKAIIANKRGIGFFLTTDAVAQVKAYRKAMFLEEELPQLFRNIYLLDIGLEELQKRYQTFINENFNQN